jgi:flagellar protein FliL
MAEAVEQTVAKKSGGKSNKLVVIIAVVVLQLVAAYFLVGLFLKHGGPDTQAQAVAAQTSSRAANSGGDPNFDHVYVVKDLIVNPAGTNGLRFLLTTIGLEVSSEETVKELEKRDVQIHDAIISILTSMTLPQLDDTGVRDSLKVSIKNEINKDLSTGSVLNVYFSKFIIQ